MAAPGAGAAWVAVSGTLEHRLNQMTPEWSPCQAEVSAAFIPQWNERRHVDRRRPSTRSLILWYDGGEKSIGSISAMPQLLNRRHELFARALASGESASTAYRAAGYHCAPHKARGHGHRLRTREDIAARVQELIDKPQNRIATQQIVEAIRTGRPTIYRPELATLARKLALLGATDQEMADALGVDQGTLDRWKTRHKEFRIAIQVGKIRADAEIAESLYNRARGMSVPAVKIFQGTPEGGPVIVPHQEHLPPDVGAAKLWLSRRRPNLWRERQEVDFSGTLAHRLNQMTPEERAADAVELMARARRRLAEYRQTIEHEPSPEPETEDQPRSQPPHRTRPGSR